MQRRWIFPSSEGNLTATHLSRELQIPAFLARVLVRNGLLEAETARDFLQPRLSRLEDPFLLPEMDKAVERVLLAIERAERIVLYGDYDVDGVASLALLKRVLTAMGGKVECFLPLRAEEGYGLSVSGVERCFEEHSPQLLIAVDCGTNSAKEIAMARARGANAIVLDHHEASDTRPDCVALVNPKLGKDFHYLCSAGVVFKLAHALLKKSPRSNIDLKDYLDLVALATIADLVPLADENRVFVHRGLQQMARTRWPGLAALMTVADVRSPVRGGDVGFRLGPRINASGRLGTALESLRLLLSDDPAEASRLAASLDQQNRSRQAVEKHLIEEVDEWVNKNFEVHRDISIVAGQRDWHHGVLGIVAARIMRRYHRPTLLIGFGEDGMGKGSGRSIEGFSLVAALGQCSEHLEKFGGHEMAAGVSVREERFAMFRQAFEEVARALSDAEMLMPRLRLDAEVELKDIGHDLLDAQEQLEPFGMANSQPVLVSRGVQPTAPPRVLKEKHLRFDFSVQRSRVGAIFFNGAEQPLPRPPWDVAYVLERNEFNGRNEPQMNIVAIRSAA